MKVAPIIIGAGLLASLSFNVHLNLKVKSLYMEKAIVQKSYIQYSEKVAKHYTEYTEDMGALNKKLTEAQDALLKITKEYKLLTTFRDAGIVPESVEEVYNLVQEFDKMPFGSPFKDGFRVTDSYGNGAPTWYRPSGVHKGLDMVPSTYGQNTIFATADGEIVDFGWSDTIGKFIIFETESGYRLKYAHLRTIYYQNDLGDVKGLQIKKGSRLAYMGASGTLATGPHLHLEITIQNEDGEYVHLNPEEIARYVGAQEE